MNQSNRKEIEIGLNVLKKVLEEVLSKNTVKDRLIEYDKEAREE